NVGSLTRLYGCRSLTDSTGKKANLKVAPPPSSEAGFGPNQWLVDEMRQQWLDDPDAVDDTWAEFFRAQRDGSDQPAGGASTDPGGSAEAKSSHGPTTETAR